MLGLGGIVVASSYVAITLTTPYVNEKGEEEYSLPGYILLTGTNAIGWVFDKVFTLLGFLFGAERENARVLNSTADGKEDKETDFEITV